MFIFRAGRRSVSARHDTRALMSRRLRTWCYDVCQLHGRAAHLFDAAAANRGCQLRKRHERLRRKKVNVSAPAAHRPSKWQLHQRAAPYRKRNAGLDPPPVSRPACPLLLIRCELQPATCLRSGKGYSDGRHSKFGSSRRSRPKASGLPSESGGSSTDRWTVRDRTCVHDALTQRTGCVYVHLRLDQFIDSIEQDAPDVPPALSPVV